MDIIYLDNYSNTSTESFLAFCDDMIIADEGFFEVAKSIGKGFVKIIKSIWNAFVGIIRKFVSIVREKLGPSRKTLRKSNEEKEEKIKELDKRIQDLENQLNISKLDTKIAKDDAKLWKDATQKYKKHATDNLQLVEDIRKESTKKISDLEFENKVLKRSREENILDARTYKSLYEQKKKLIEKLEKERDELKDDLQFESKMRDREGEFNRMISALKNITSNYTSFLRTDINKASRGIPILQSYVAKCAKYRGERYSNLQGRYRGKVERDLLSDNNLDRDDRYTLHQLTEIYNEDDYSKDVLNSGNSGRDFSDIESWRKVVKSLDDTRFKMFQTLITMITKELGKWQSDLGKIKDQLENVAKVADSISDQSARGYATKATSKPVKWFNYRVRYTGNLITKYMSLLSDN